MIKRTWRVFPTTRSESALSIVIIVVTILIWITRAQLDRYLYDRWIEGGGLAEAGAFTALCPVFFFAAIVIVFLIFWAIRYAKNGQLSPALLLAGFMLTWFLPLPPLPPYPEEITFPNDRANYEYVVEMARRNQLEHDDMCRSNIAFALPSDYKYLSNGCVFMYPPSASSPLVIEFLYSANRYIVYAVAQEALTSSEACYGDGSVHKQLDENWYICVQDSL